jgi:predicted nucleic acid-binding protein
MSVFLDTNLLIYARDRGAVQKRTEIRRWIDELAARDALVVNLQVINEFINVVLKRETAATPDAVKAAARDLLVWGDAPLDRTALEAAWHLRSQTGYSWFDCLLLASAIGLGCSVFLSEDMQHSHDLRAIVILNPFLADLDAVLRRLA